MLNRVCFEGFKIAQQKIVTELRELQSFVRVKKAEIKQARRDKNKSKEDDITEVLSILNYQNNIFRNLADSIAWQLLNGEHYIYRRLYTHETNDKDLNEKSYN